MASSYLVCKCKYTFFIHYAFSPSKLDKGRAVDVLWRFVFSRDVREP